jgi:hypothetical protein
LGLSTNGVSRGVGSLWAWVVFIIKQIFVFGFRDEGENFKNKTKQTVILKTKRKLLLKTISQNI